MWVRASPEPSSPASSSSSPRPVRGAALGVCLRFWLRCCLWPRQAHPQCAGRCCWALLLGSGSCALPTVAPTSPTHPLPCPRPALPCATEMQQRRVVLVCNLKPANMRGIQSQAMVLAATSPDGSRVRPPALVLLPSVACQACKLARSQCH